MPTNLQKAANSLGQSLFKARWSKDGSVGLMAPATLVVYINGAQSTWKGPTPTIWDTFKVEWHYDMGPKVMATQPPANLPKPAAKAPEPAAAPAKPKVTHADPVKP